ncbi:lytic transglycosylase domain-containing protein [Trinickia fusca]|uniref:Lytic transglycosylase domain-containing protein n=1 Tax=Trinickia fusca TaxID=2419777 RepID=A0A494X1H7_9BURK|nr:lytic transglycosylase domain-containing protein [Trinickia fusca]RKP44577.1 lytic transglycosylase domain-containing protein [Trinickia fusca]
MNHHFGRIQIDRSFATRVSIQAMMVCTSLLCSGCYGADTSAASVPSSIPDIAASASNAESTPSAGDIAKTLNVQFHIGMRESLKIANAVLNAAQRDMVSPILLLAVIAVESNFDRHAVNPSGASGLMQIMASAHRDRVARVTDLTDADTNVSIGSAILREYLQAANGDMHDALLRYSGGAKGYPLRVADRMRRIGAAVVWRGQVQTAASAVSIGYR